MVKLSTRSLWIMIVAIGVAILILMLFSIDRTAWALALFETGRQFKTQRSVAGSLVVELAAVAFIIAKSINVAEIRRLATVGLVGVLIVLTLANLMGSWVHGWNTLRATMPDSRPALAVSVLAWASINALIPGGIYLLSEIEALLVRYLLAMYAEERTALPETVPQSAPAPATVPSSAPQAVRVVVEDQETAPTNVERTAPAHQTGTIQVERTKAETWQTIMNALTAPTPRSLSAIGADLGISESMVRKHRTEMEQAGLLVRNGKTYSKNGVALEVI